MSTRYEDSIYRFKLKVAKLLHSSFPGKYCWADCVTWAYARKRWNPFKIDNARGCEQESKDHPHKLCYCGGWQDGQCWDKLPKKERDRIHKEAEEARLNNPDTADLPF